MKITKGVECEIVPDEEMPTDDFGNVSDVVVYGRSAIARLNPGQLFEQYLGASMRDISLDIKQMVENGNSNGAWDFLLGYLKIASPPQAEVCSQLNSRERKDYLEGVCQKGLYLHCPADADWITIDTYDDLQAYRPVNESPVTYTNSAGAKVRTNLPALIGGKYMIVLEKSDSKPMACAGSRVQHHGLPAVATKNTRNSTPTKEQPPRVWGESEVRALSATIGGAAVANILDYTTNPNTHKAITRSVFGAKDPSNIKSLVDRNEIPLGKARPQAHVRHQLLCYGIKMERTE